MSALTVPACQVRLTYLGRAVSEVDEGDPEAHPATAGNPLTFLFIIIGTIVALYLCPQV
jgi:hypothetical protein